jgi:hypothetical protein
LEYNKEDVMNLKVLRERLGHASIQITLDTYSHVAPGLQEAAAARFDQAFIAGIMRPRKYWLQMASSKLVAKSVMSIL